MLEKAQQNSVKMALLCQTQWIDNIRIASSFLFSLFCLFVYRSDLDRRVPYMGPG